MPALAPTAFTENLKTRATHLRFRGVGNPYAFLDEVGILPIKEQIYKGSMLIDIAEDLNLPLSTLRTWIKNNDLDGEIEEASVTSAEGYIQQGERLLKAATNKFELDKAKAMIEHGRFMASKKDKKQYGNQLEISGGPAAVHYAFILPSVAPVELNARAPAPRIINSEAKEIPQVTLDMQLGMVPEHIESGVQPVEQVDE